MFLLDYNRGNGQNFTSFDGNFNYDAAVDVA